MRGKPQPTLSFPQDHGSHSDAALEWWYWTGHLTGDRGREYGFELVFFRLKTFHFAHFAWTDVAAKTFRFDEKAHLDLPGMAFAKEGTLDVTNEDWSAKEKGGRQILHAEQGGAELSLELSPEKPPVLNGANGLSKKGNGPDEYSHYVSITRLAARGTREVAGKSEAVAGVAWFDHEWGPGGMPPEAEGWDWFSLQLSDGSEVMLYRMRRPDGMATPFSSGTFVPAKGASQPIAWKDVALQPISTWISPRSKARYPSAWRIRIASLDLAVTVTPLVPDQELSTERSTAVTYWEGACGVEGTHGGKPISGRAYVELTGYAGRDVPGLGLNGLR